MTDHPNVAILRPLYEKWADKTLEPSDWIDALADDVEWRSIGEESSGLEFSAASRSKDEVLQYFERLAKDWEMLSYDADEFVAEGDRVVMIGRCSWRSKETGKVVETPKVDVFRMRDGKITHFFEFFDTAKAVAATC